MNKFRKGDRVRCHRDHTSSHTWHQWQGREGVVAVGRNDGGEVGVALGTTTEGNERVVWFLPADLMKL